MAETGAPKTRAALAEYLEAVDAYNREYMADNPNWIALARERDRYTALAVNAAQCVVEEKVLDRLDRLEAERAALVAVADALARAAKYAIRSVVDTSVEGRPVSLLNREFRTELREALYAWERAKEGQAGGR